ncbi:MAG: tRNA modification GTPase [Gemmataceae bacterium]|nr:tRNA modification GTPase [Gemmataceae bacterium]
MLDTSRRADPDDVIVALATPPGPGRRAVVRLSGRGTAQTLRGILPSFYRDGMKARQIVRDEIMLPGLASGLPMEAIFAAGPKTYTGQDLAEIHLISSMPLVELLVAQLLNAGARSALPGEFTQRAFLAGKLDLTQAEAVLGVIEANRRDDLTTALQQLAGGLANPLHALRDDLMNLLADIEASLDFMEEDIRFVGSTEMLTRISHALAKATLLRRQAEQRSASNHRFRVVLAGKPNAGKSSLFNALVGKNAAIVSEQAGTTRDWLEANARIEDVELQLVDTAGFRGTDDAIETQAQSLGRDASRRADLILLCIEGERDEASEFASEVPIVVLATKSDLAEPSPGLLAVSATTGEGLDVLRPMLAERARHHGTSPMAPSLSRCRHHLDACIEHLRRAHGLALDESPAELLALEIRLALDELGSMVGAVYTDDLLDRIFSRFCIGK